MSNITDSWRQTLSTTSLEIPLDCHVIVGQSNTNPLDVISLQAEHIIDYFYPSSLFDRISQKWSQHRFFSKLGLKDRINLCLFCLAFIDLAILSFLFIMCINFMTSPNQFADKFGPFWKFLIVNHIHGTFGLIYGSMFLSVIVACKRCFCVLFPLQANTFLKTKTMTVIVIVGVSFWHFPVRLFSSSDNEMTKHNDSVSLSSWSSPQALPSLFFDLSINAKFRLEFYRNK